LTPKGIRLARADFKTVLIVDHNSPSLISMAEHLGAESKDAHILMARSPAGAIDLARYNQPDVAILVPSAVETSDNESLIQLILNVSPKTRIIVAENPPKPPNA